MGTELASQSHGKGGCSPSNRIGARFGRESELTIYGRRVDVGHAAGVDQLEIG
jgi:hypothetical protein